jgi:hypothetical protein
MKAKASFFPVRNGTPLSAGTTPSLQADFPFFPVPAGWGDDGGFPGLLPRRHSSGDGKTAGARGAPPESKHLPSKGKKNV